MKILQIFSLFLLGLSSWQCSMVEDKISGIWQLENSENCKRIFLGLHPFIDPYVMYGHKIYVSDSLFYNPSMKEEGLPFERRYNIKGEQIFLESIGQINFTRKDSILLLEKEGCKLTFIRRPKGQTIPEDSLSNISFYVSDDEGDLVDSLHLHKTASNAYIFRIAGSIAKENLDRTFDEGVLDTNEYKIILHLRNGQSFRITSYGKYETPFEIQTLIRYLLTEI
jgi:hypothetical protein